MSRTIRKTTQPKTRSHVAVAAHFATGAGTHGGSKLRRNRKERQSARQSIRRQEW